jgi:hypothetical protein
MSTMTSVKIGLNSLLKQKYLNNDRQVYSSLEYFCSEFSEKNFDKNPYGIKIEKYKDGDKKPKTAQSEIDVLKMKKVKESSLMKSKAYHKVYIDKLNKKYLKC